MIYTNNDGNARTIALLEAIRLCGSEKNLGLIAQVQQPAISKWLSDPSITIAYDTAIAIEQAFGINIERLIPDKPEINSYLKERSFSSLPLRLFLKHTISTTNSVSLTFLQPNQFIIMGTDGVLIFGLNFFNNHSEHKITALALDLTAIITRSISIKDLLSKLSIMERLAIGLRLEQLIVARQGKKITTTNFNQILNGVKYQIIGRTETYIAQIIGFTKDTYIRGKQVYLSNNQELINAVNHKTMSIAKAANLIKQKKL